jgi:hypothetical protein
MSENGAEDPDELTVPVGMDGQGRPHPLERLREFPLLEGGTVA